VSRELDATVAEKVMGFVWDESRCRICGWPFGDGVADCTKDSCSLRPTPKRRADAPAHYSTSIADAWLVVEEMIKRHPERDFHLEHLHDQWGCGNCTDDVWTSADTAPEAICLAALEAVK